MADEREQEVSAAPVESVKLVDKDRIKITFLIDELLSRVDLGNIRPVVACNDRNGCG